MRDRLFLRLALLVGATLLSVASASGQVRESSVGGGAQPVNCVQGCSGGTTDTDDNTVAGGQATGLSLTLPYFWDGANWKRLTGSGGSLNVICTSGCTPGGSFADNAAFTFGTTAVNVFAGVRDDTAPNAATENSAAAVRISGNRMALFQIGDGAGNERRANVNASSQLEVAVGNTVTVSASNLDVQSGGADLATETTAAGILTSTNFAAAFGTAGTADSQVLSVQGVASMTPLLVDGSAVTQPVSNGGLTELAAAINASSQVDVNIAAAGVAVPVTDNGASLTVDGTVAVSGTVTVDGSGVTQPVSHAALTELAAAIDTEVQVDVVGALPAGNNNIGDVDLASLPNEGQQTMANSVSVAIASNQSAVPVSATDLDVQSGGADLATAAAQTTGNTSLATIAGDTTDIEAAVEQCSGATEHFTSSAASTNATSAKGSAGVLCGIEVVNTTSTLYYLRLYNLAAAPTCSSATGFRRSIPIPHGTGTGAGVVSPTAFGVTYGTGIAFCLTGGGSSTDNTNAATGVYVTLFYK